MLEIKGEWFHCPPGYACGYKKRMKKKKQYFLDIQSSRQKARNNARHCRTPTKSNIVSIGCYVWLLSTRLPANRECLLKPYTPMLGKSARTVSREFYLEKTCLRWPYFLWLAEGVATVLCCAKLVFMLFTISLRIKTLYFVFLGK